MLQGGKNETALATYLYVINLGFGFYVCEKTAILMVVNFDDFFVCGNYFLRLGMELDLLNWHPVVVTQSVDRDRVTHIVQHYFTFLGADRHLKS